MIDPEQNSPFTFHGGGPSAEKSLTNGNLIRTWFVADDNGHDGLGHESGIYGQLFDASGVALGDAFRVDAGSPGDHAGVSVVALDDGGFMIGWNSVSARPDLPNPQWFTEYAIDSQFLTQRFDATGVAQQGGPTVVAEAESHDAYIGGSLSNLVGGQILQYWTETPLTSGRYVNYLAHGQVLDATGVAVSPVDILGHGRGSFGTDPLAVAQLPNGGYVVVSSAEGDNPSNWQVIRIGVFDADGTSIAEPIFVETLERDISGTRVTALTDGNFIVRWNSGALLYGADGAPLDLTTHPIAAGNHAPVFSGDDEPLIVDVNEFQDFILRPVSATDPDGDAIIYTIIGGADAGRVVQSSEGWLFLADYENPQDANGDNMYELVVRASDTSFYAYDDRIVYIRITDVDENLSLASYNGAVEASVAFSEAALTSAARVAATSPAGKSLYYSILGGADAALFQLDSDSSGANIRFKAAPDFEAPDDLDHDNVYEIVVGATDDQGHHIEQTLHITVTDAPENNKLIVGTIGNDVISPTSTVANQPLPGDGADIIYGGYGNDILDGGNGADTLIGEQGADVYWFDGNDIVIEKKGQGRDKMVSANADILLAANVEDGELLDGGLARILTGNALKNHLIGNSANNSLWGGAGNDTLSGGRGSDMLTGGTGKDLFKFDASLLADGLSAMDVITDFHQNEGDRIDLRAVDAKTGKAGNQNFTFIGEAGFSGAAGELRYGYVDGDTILSGDVTGDGVADFQVMLAGLIAVTASDFIL